MPLRRPRTFAEFAQGLGILLGTIAVALSVALPSLVIVHQSNERRAQSCTDRINLWNGEIDVIRLIGHELHGTTARIDVAVQDFIHDGHPKPNCR